MRLAHLDRYQLKTPLHFLFRRWVHLYAQRFPFYERAPVAVLAEDLLSGHLKIEGDVFRDSYQHWQWASFTCLECYPTDVLLAYLATDPRFEGRGLASQLVTDQCWQMTSIERPHFWLEAEPKLWGFYRKQGFYQLNFSYEIPRFYQEGTVKMALFVKSRQTRLTRDHISEFVSTLYLKSYGVKEDDPRYLDGMRAVQSLPDTINLPKTAVI
jgi:GNAT superfamily N-acetyltransferase